MGVGVERPVDHYLAEHRGEQPAGQREPVAARQPPFRVAHVHPVQPLQHEDTRGRRVHGGDPDLLRAAGGDRGDVACLDADVEFLAQRSREPLGHIQHAELACPASPRVQRTSQPQQDV